MTGRRAAGLSVTSTPSPLVQCVCLVPHVAKVTDAKTNQMGFRKRFRDPLELKVIGKYSLGT